METLLSLDHLHHALIITGAPQASFQWVQSSLESQGVSCQGNPDVYKLQGEQFLANFLEPLQEYLSRRKVSPQRYILLAFEYVPSDIQNKLLKIFEEPQEGTHLILMVPDIEKIIPTIRSRSEHMIYRGISSSQGTLSVSSFLKGTTAERYLLIESWVKNKKEEENALKSELQRFCQDLEKELWSRYQVNRLHHETHYEELFADLRLAQHMISSRGMSHRLVLDYLAMRCPEQLAE